MPLVVAAVVGCTKADPGVVEVHSASKDDDDGESADDADDKGATDDDSDADECKPGTERCDCRGEEECDEGLECRSGLCVEAAGSTADDDPPTDDDSQAEPSDDAEPVPASDDDAPVGPVEPEAEPARGGSGPGEPAPSPVAAGGAGSEPQPEPAAGSGGTSGSGGSGGTPVASGGQGSTAPLDFVNPPDNLITNPEFANAESDWTVEAASYGYTTDSGAMCLFLSVNVYGVNVGWPSSLPLAVALDPSLSYELSYDAVAFDASALTFTAKVGEADAPYTPHFEADVDVRPQWTRFTHGFEPLTTSPSGVVFILRWTSGGDTEVCIDNVVLRVQ